MKIRGDGHVHLYPLFDRDRFFQTALVRAGSGQQGPFLLLMAERSSEAVFLELRGAARASVAEDCRRPPAAYTVETTAEPLSLRIRGPATGPSEPALFMVCGRQFVSREGLEVIAVALDPAHPLYRTEDRTLAAAELLQRLLDAGAAAGLPWGVGKWLGARGREVQRLTALPGVCDHRRFFLGDIAARCRPWPEPVAFRRGRVLAGSDMLPIPGRQRRLGSYGFRLTTGGFAAARPAAAFLTALEAADAVETTGNRQSAFAVIVDQIRYRLRRGRTR